MKIKHILSTKKRDLSPYFSLNSYLGKKVYSKLGQPVGKVKDILVDNNSLVGLIISGNIFIDIEFISETKNDAVMLNINPVTSLISKSVFDSDGRHLGKVTSIQRKTNQNTYHAIVVKKSIISKSFWIEKKDIKIADENIILKNIFTKENERNNNIR